MTDLQTTVDMMAGAWPGQRMRQPLPPAVLDEWITPRTASAAGTARRRVRGLAARIAGDDLASDVELLAGEMLANAVTHGQGATMWVRVIAEQQALRVEIHDGGMSSAGRTGSRDSLAERGRGLFIVAALAACWGLDHDEHGTTAWFEVDP